MKILLVITLLNLTGAIAMGLGSLAQTEISFEQIKLIDPYFAEIITIWALQDQNKTKQILQATAFSLPFLVS